MELIDTLLRAEQPSLRSEALILLGAKLNVPCTTRRVNYKGVIYNLKKIAASLKLPAMTW